MIRDVIFEEHYAKKVNAHTQQVAQQAFMAGRQQGWNDILFIVNNLQQEKQALTPEKIVEELKQMMQANEQVEVQEEQEAPKRKNPFSVVK